MTDPRHARILANIAAEVARQYTLTRSGVTSDPDKGNVPVPDPVPDRVAPSHPWDAFNVERARQDAERIDPSWNYTLPEEYQA